MRQVNLLSGVVKLRYEVGKPYGELYGKTFQYGADGKIKTDSQGIPMLTKDYNCYLGNANSPHHLGCRDRHIRIYRRLFKQEE